MAFIINTLLTAECIFRIFTCLIAEPIKMAFLFLGWIPTFLSQFALALDEIINNPPHEPADMCMEGTNDITNFTSCTDRNDTRTDWFYFKMPDADNYTRVPFKTVEAICFLPTCISQFGTIGTCIFVMLISIVRYVGGRIFTNEFKDNFNPQ